MIRLNTKRSSMQFIETVFDIAYLSAVFISAALLCVGSTVGGEGWRFGIMALILGIGDSCHLIPRINFLWDSSRKDHTTALGIGKLAASITMTIFYMILWDIGVKHYAIPSFSYLTPVVYALAALRIVLCLMPQNGWTSKSPSLKWAIWRNIPFLALGMVVMALFAIGAHTKGGAFPYLWLAIFISFACYMPVVLFSGRNAKVGMLMLPKSCAYVAIVLMGFSLPIA
ncbi:MAG: hypothetical protein ACOYJD_08425 [Christensenellales bacterium]|jgi:hypothetical protein